MARGRGRGRGGGSQPPPSTVVNPPTGAVGRGGASGDPVGVNNQLCDSSSTSSINPQTTALPSGTPVI
ncbi:hypothetical protein E2C01_019156 [Portunus trituberculatus]|uniref:Uncharacterized protein n=1 Tax=Portunus trituberculatus TaxID=210409 RepID=A0A5B7DY98_PORTR|nr:hypothetical protein [Portunus trituberculatus]